MAAVHGTSGYGPLFDLPALSASWRASAVNDIFSTMFAFFAFMRCWPGISLVLDWSGHEEVPQLVHGHFGGR